MIMVVWLYSKRAKFFRNLNNLGFASKVFGGRGGVRMRQTSCLEWVTGEQGDGDWGLLFILYSWTC